MTEFFSNRQKQTGFQSRVLIGRRTVFRANIMHAGQKKKKRKTRKVSIELVTRALCHAVVYLVSSAKTRSDEGGFSLILTLTEE